MERTPKILAAAAGCLALLLGGCATQPNQGLWQANPAYAPPAQMRMVYDPSTRSYVPADPYGWRGQPARGYAQPYGQQAQPARSTAGAAIVGGAAGAILGHQFGRGSGRTASTALGAAVGSSLATGCGNVTGGVVGGLLGSLVGKGKGRDAAAATGAAFGSQLGCP